MTSARDFCRAIRENNEKAKRTMKHHGPVLSDAQSAFEWFTCKDGTRVSRSICVVIEAECTITHDPGVWRDSNNEGYPASTDIEVFPRSAEVTVMYRDIAEPSLLHEIMFRIWTHTTLVEYLALWGIDAFDPDIYHTDDLLPE
jgi:hypothetical protein